MQALEAELTACRAREQKLEVEVARLRLEREQQSGPRRAHVGDDWSATALVAAQPDVAAELARALLHPIGLDAPTEEQLKELRRRKKLALSNLLTVRGLELCAAVFESGGEALIENPPDYGIYGLWTKDPRSAGSGTDSAWRKENLFEPRHCECSGGLRTRRLDTTPAAFSRPLRRFHICQARCGIPRGRHAT